MENSLTHRTTLPITIIGAGALGSALALDLHKRHYSIRAVFSRRGKSANALAKKVGATQSGILSSQALDDQIVFIAARDDEIEKIVFQILKLEIALSRSIVFHTSGALSSAVLSPLKKRGAAVGSFHPLQTFPKMKLRYGGFREVFVAVEGDPKALAAGKRIARDLGAHPFVLSSRQKVLYHIAAVFASNYFVTLLSIVEDLGLRIGVPRKQMVAMVEPLLLQSLKNVRTSSASSALTGPIARGDVRTISKHRRALATKELNHVSQLYAALAMVTTRLTSKKRI